MTDEIRNPAAEQSPAADFKGFTRQDSRDWEDYANSPAGQSDVRMALEWILPHLESLWGNFGSWEVARRAWTGSPVGGEQKPLTPDSLPQSGAGLVTDAIALLGWPVDLLVYNTDQSHEDFVFKERLHHDSHWSDPATPAGGRRIGSAYILQEAGLSPSAPKP